MSRGAAVIRYQGKRGAVWRIKYRDAAGKQIQETLGPEPPWTERKAQRELGKRLAAVDEGYRKPERVTFSDFAERFVREYLPGRNVKPTTAENYDYILRRHLLPFFGDNALADLEARPELIDAYVALKAEGGLSPKTIQNHLLLLNVMFRRAVVWRLIRTNPVSSIDRPRLAQPEMSVLTEAEIARLNQRLRRARGRGLGSGAPVVAARQGDRPHGARDGDATRRAHRPALARDQPARGEDRSPRGVRARPLHDTEEQGFPACRRARPAHARRSRGDQAPHCLSRGRRSRFRTPDQGDAGRHQQAREALPQACARSGRDREAFPPLP